LVAFRCSAHWPTAWPTTYFISGRAINAAVAMRWSTMPSNSASVGTHQTFLAAIFFAIAGSSSICKLVNDWPRRNLTKRRGRLAILQHRGRDRVQVLELLGVLERDVEPHLVVHMSGDWQSDLRRGRLHGPVDLRHDDAVRLDEIEALFMLDADEGRRLFRRFWRQPWWIGGPAKCNAGPSSLPVKTSSRRRVCDGWPTHAARGCDAVGDEQ
jgi:hypothetical protein